MIRFFTILFVFMHALILHAIPELPRENSCDVPFLNTIADTDPGRLFSIADSARNAGDDDKAMSLYLASARLFGKDSRAAKAYLSAGDILMKKCNYAGALDNYILALKISESLPGTPMGATIYKNIGNVYNCVNDYKKGIYYYTIGLNLCRENSEKDYETEWKLLVNLAGFNTYLENTEEANRFLKEARSIPAKDNIMKRYMHSLVEGMVKNVEKDYSGAMKCFREAVHLADNDEMERRFLCSAIQNIYILYENTGKPDSAFLYMKKCERLATDAGIIRMFPSLYRSLSDYYRKKGDVPNTQLYMTKYLDMRDSIGSESEINAVKTSQFMYEVAKVSDTINSLHKAGEERDNTIRRQLMVLWSVLGGFIVLAAMLIVIYRQKKKITGNYHALYEINRQLADSQSRLKEELSRQHSADTAEKKDSDKTGKTEKGYSTSPCNAASEAQPENAQPEESKYSSSNLDNKRRDSLCNAITDIMNRGEAFCNQSFSLDTLAELVGSNTKYVSQTINEAFGKNFNCFVNDYRISLARERLSDPEFSNYTIKAIGESVGFGSQSVFTSYFKKATGLTPAIYQKMDRQSAAAAHGGNTSSDS